MRRSAITLIALLALGCASGGGSDEGGEFIVDFDATLTPVGDAQVSGWARAIASVGRTALTVSLDNGTPEARHPWHVHRGTCGSGGAIVGPTADYPLLVLDAEGSGRALTTISVQLDDDEDYYVNIHRSQSDMATIVACGQLED